MPYDFKLNYEYFQKIDLSASWQKFLPGGPLILPNTFKMEVRNRKKVDFGEKKNFNFENVAGISDWGCCRNFWQHDGDPSTLKCSETRFYAIL